MSPPTLWREGYSSRPSMSELSLLSEVELSRLKGFEVWRGGFGGIAWKGEVNVNGVDLDSSVTIGRGYVAVRDGGCLNAPAQVSLVDVWACENRQLDVSDSEHCTDPLEERLRSYCEKVGTSFVSFDGQSGRWVFDVDHFSRYGFLDDDDEEDSENGNVRSTTAVDPSGRVDDSGFSRTGAETVNAADNSVDSRGKNTTPSRVLSVPDDWSDTGEDVEPIEEDEDMERIDLGGGAKFSVFRTLEAPKLQRMQASLFRNEGPRPEKMSPGRKWAVDESSMSTETEGEPRRVRARQSPSRPISRPKTSLFGKVPTMELSETYQTSAQPLSSLAHFTRLEDSIVNGAEASKTDPLLACGRSFRFSFSGAGRLASIHLPERAGESFGIKFSTFCVPMARSCYEPLLRLHQEAWKSNLSNNLTGPDVLVPTLDNAYGTSISTRDESLQNFATLFAEKGEQHLEVIFRLLFALYGDREGFREEILRARVSKWLSEHACSWSQDQPPSSDYLQGIFCLLSGGLVDDAGETAILNANFRLAMLVSRAMEFPGRRFHEDVEAFVEDFAPGNTDTEEGRSMIDLLHLLAGKITETSKLRELSWYRAFGLFLWYASSARSDLSIRDAVKAFADCWSADKLAPPPVPPYASGKPFEDRLTIAQHGELDSAYQILCLYADVDSEKGVERALSTFSTGERKNCADYRASWVTFQALSGIVGAGARIRRECRLHAAFSQQLESCGLPLWSVYVMASCPPSAERDAALRSQIWRLWPTLRNDSVFMGEDRIGMIDFLVDQLKIPTAWLLEGRALLARYEHASAEEAEALCALSDTTQDILPRLEAHELLCRSVTPRILSLAVKGSTGWESAAKRTMELLHGLSEQTLPSWDIMGGVVLTFLTLLCGEGSERNKYWNDGPYLHSFMSRVPHFPVTDDDAGRFLRFVMANFGASLERRLYLYKWAANGEEAASAWGQVARSDLVSACLSPSHSLQLVGDFAGDDKLGAEANRRWSVPISSRFGVPLLL